MKTRSTGWWVLVVVLAGSSVAGAQTVLWENRGQPEIYGGILDVAGGPHVFVGAGGVGDEINNQWFVRGFDRRTGVTEWEDRYGPMLFGLAKDVVAEGHRAFVAGWTRVPGQGFVFAVRAYAERTGTVAWTHEISRGPRCVEEFPGFARCVAKAVDVRDGRVFAVGHLTRTAARPDFAVVALDAATGALLWESVTDPTGTGAGDAAWAVAADRDSVFVLGEIGDSGSGFTGLLLRSYNARTGAIRWQQELPGAQNFTYKNTLVTDGKRVFVAGMDAKRDFLVRAYDARSGAPSWVDTIDDGDLVGQAGALVLGTDGHGRDRVFATGVIGCDPASLLGCKLAVRAYDPRAGLVWARAEEAGGGDWYPGYTAAASGGRVFVTAGELLSDGQYHATVRAYESRDGNLLWEEPFDPGNDPAGFSDVSVVGNRLFIGGTIFTGTDGSADSVVRAYRANERVDDDEPDADHRE